MADLSDVAVVALSRLWSAAGLPSEQLRRVTLSGQDPVFASSFAVGTAAQVSIAAAGLMATLIGARRDPRQAARRVAVSIEAAALECTAAFRLDGVMPPVWDPLSGLYRCGRNSDPDQAAGWVRIHANFAHHRLGALRLLGLGDEATRSDVERALGGWRAEDVEAAADEAGLCIAALRTRRQWHAHGQARALANQPLVAIEQIGDAAPLPWPELPAPSEDGGQDGLAPLTGLRTLDLTRILAGPVGCRTLASYGADVLTVHAPGLPNIAALADTSRGKRSALIDLREDSDRLRALVGQADVFVQSARPGAIAAAGFGPRELHRIRPGIIVADLDAWGDQGPWGRKRGFDSLVQTATGLNDDERFALERELPTPLPVQILDYATGFLLAFGVQAALLRQREQGGSWRVHLSLARTAAWLRELGRYAIGPVAPTPAAGDPGAGLTAEAIAAALRPFPSDYGQLEAMPHAARFDPPIDVPMLPSRPPGSDAALWPDGTNR